jgi:hypothetical protein
MPTTKTFEKFTQLLLAAYEHNGDTDIMWTPDIEMFEVELDKDDNFLLSGDIITSSQELQEFIKKKRGGNNEGN